MSGITVNYRNEYNFQENLIFLEMVCRLGDLVDLDVIFLLSRLQGLQVVKGGVVINQFPSPLCHFLLQNDTKYWTGVCSIYRCALFGVFAPKPFHFCFVCFCSPWHPGTGSHSTPWCARPDRAASPRSHSTGDPLPSTKNYRCGFNYAKL